MFSELGYLECIAGMLGSKVGDEDEWLARALLLIVDGHSGSDLRHDVPSSPPGWRSRTLIDRRIVPQFGGRRMNAADNLLPLVSYIAASALSRSAMMSSTSSMPTEIRTRPSVIPIALRPFSPSAACVIVAGCEINVSTPPSDSPSEQTRTRFSSFLALPSEPVSKVIMEPNPDICRCASSCWGWSGCPG